MEKNGVSPPSPEVSAVRLSGCIEDLVKFMLQCSINGVDLGVSAEFFSGLLRDEDEVVDDGVQCSKFQSSPQSDLSEGVPLYPLYKHLASALKHWIVSGSFFSPFGQKIVEGRCATVDYTRMQSGDLILFNNCLMLQVQDVHHYASFVEMLEAESLEKVLPGVLSIEEGERVYRRFYTKEKEQLNGVLAICVGRPASQPYSVLSDIIAGLGYRGIQSLLGLKQTAGTIPQVLPPPRSTLLSSFTLPHKREVKGCGLTDGARALAKHVNRCSSNYWGKFEGNDSAKNRLALEVITRIILRCCWMNVHIVQPHDAVFEVRVAEGYGARWSKDGTKFIGFLEPYMEDGHSKKWRH